MSARIFCVFSLICVPVLLCGQQSQITGPVSGYVFDNSAHGLRPVQGIPGAALLGDPVDFGLQISSVAVAPRQDAAFVTAADGTLHLFRIQPGAPADLSLNGLANSPDRVSFSPSGTAAVLHGRGSIQIVSGLPDSAAIAASLSLSAAPDSLAISDDGSALLVASGNTVELFAGAADQGAVATTAGPALIAFAPSGHDAAVVDRTGTGIVLFHNLGSAVDSQNLAPTDEAIQSATALAFSIDGRQLLVAAGNSVTAFDLTAGARNRIPCGCTPSTLARMGDLFRLNELSREPLWLLDARPETAGVTFVPAVASSEVPVQRRPVRPGRPVRGLTPADQTIATPSRSQVSRSE
jgi:hypothetical protein